MKKRGKIKLIIFAIFIISVILIIINYSNVFVMTGKTIALYENDSDFLTGTFTNTTSLSDNVQLNKLVPIGDYVDSEPPYSMGWADNNLQGRG